MGKRHVAQADAPPKPETPAGVKLDRDRLLSAMLDLCQAGYGQTSPETREQIEDIFLNIIKRTEREIRLRLADRLASAPWAPSALINALALDDIDIARPIIAKSPVLKNHDLIRLLTVATVEHQIAVAERPNLDDVVVSAIVDQAAPAVLQALCSNNDTEISPSAMARLVSAAERAPALQPLLSRRAELNLELAGLLYTWTGDVLKSEIARRFRVEGAAFDQAVKAAAAAALAGAPIRVPAGDRLADSGETERHLVAKLEAAGQLRPGFLLRSLREGKLHQFEVALATLTNVKTEEVQAAIRSAQPELLALACASIGLDRSVFPTVLSLVQSLNAGKPAWGTDAAAHIAAAFNHAQPQDAISAFRRNVAELAKPV